MTDDMNPADRLMNILNEDMVSDAETAIELVEVLIRRNYGDDALKAQQPLSARDDGKYWWVEGPPNALEKSTGVGPVHVQLKKADAGVASLYNTLPSALQAKFRKGDAP